MVLDDTNHPSPVDKEEVIALAKQIAGHGTCMCGKLNLTEQEAIFIVSSTDYDSDKYYSCPLNGKVYFHATSHGNGKGRVKPKSYGSNRFKFNSKRLLRELQAQQEYAKIIEHKEEAEEIMAAVEDQALTKTLVKYMESLWNRTQEYKISSGMIYAEFPGYVKGTLAAQLSGMKKAKIITSLDEKVPDQKGAHYFALTSILDEVTKPTSPVDKKEVSVEMSKVTSVPAQSDKPKVTPIVANPFEKVQAQLEAINTRLNGLAQGYADTLDTQKNIREEISEGIAEVVKNQQILRNVQENPVRLDIDDLVSKLCDLNNPDAFIYQIRDSVDVPGHLTAAFMKMKDLPKNLSDDYKRGLRDGIRMAVEMGIKLDGN